MDYDNIEIPCEMMRKYVVKFFAEYFKEIMRNAFQHHLDECSECYKYYAQYIGRQFLVQNNYLVKDMDRALFDIQNLAITKLSKRIELPFLKE